MTKTFNYFLLALFTIFTSCSTSDDGSLNWDDNGNEDQINTSYWPCAIGNEWKFRNIDDLEDTLIERIYKTINYDGKTYYQFEPLDAPDDYELTNGFREDNGVFYELHGSTSQMGVHTSAGTIKSMNTTLAIGEEWTDEMSLTISGASIGTIKHLNKGKILEKAAAVNIDGKTYKNVLKMELIKTISTSNSGISHKIKYEDWLAKGVGPIYRKTTYYYGNDENIEQYELIDYSLN